MRRRIDRLAWLTGAAGLLLICCASTARASDFWDRVRDPGARICLKAVGDARKALGQGDGDAALKLAERAIAASSRAEAWLVKALALAKLKRDADACEALRHTLELDGRALDGHRDDTVALTTSALSAGELELGASILGRLVLSMKPSGERQSLYGLYADILGALGPEHSREALLAYRYSLRGLWNRDLRSMLGVALALHRAGDIDEALRRVRAIGSPAAVLRAIASLPLPPYELAARRALLREATEGDAVAEWRQATQGPWAAHAHERLPENQR